MIYPIRVSVKYEYCHTPVSLLSLHRFQDMDIYSINDESISRCSSESVIFARKRELRVIRKYVMCI